jgi:hypothetical protein
MVMALADFTDKDFEAHKGGAEVWADGWAEGEGKGGVRVYEAYEVKNKRGKLRCLLLHLKKENMFFIFMM